MSRAAILLLIPLLMGAEPRAVLTGPKSAEVGAPIFLSVAGSVADSDLEWDQAEGPVAVPIAELFTRDEALAYGVATAPQPGTYVFVLIATGTRADGTPARDYGFLTVSVGGVSPPPPGPGPVPPAPGPPDPPAPGKYGLTPFVEDLARKARPDLPETRRAVVATLEALFVQMAAESGKYPQVQPLIDETGARIKAGLGDAYATFRPPILVPLNGRLNGLVAEGRLNTVADVAVAYREIAEGFRRGR